MDSIAARAQADATTKRELYLNGISERTRSLCLGALILIWGLFTQKVGEGMLNVRHWQRIALAIVGIGAIVVLTFDMAEFWFGFRLYDRLTPDDPKPKQETDRNREQREQHNASRKPPDYYHKWRNAAMKAKLLTGSLTLLALCMLLITIVFGSIARGDENDGPANFEGLWCHALSPYTCLEITAFPSDYLTVKLSINLDGWGDADCNDQSVLRGILTATCKFTVSGKAVPIQAWFRVPSDQDGHYSVLHLKMFIDQKSEEHELSYISRK
jgi:hypothetical protein